MYVETYQRRGEMSLRHDILASRELKCLAKMSWRRNVATCLRRRRGPTFSGKNEMSGFRLLQLSAEVSDASKVSQSRGKCFLGSTAAVF